MSDPYGGPFAAWDPGATYSAGQRVSYGGYIYEAMTAISAGDDPRTATYTETFTNRIGPGTTTATMRKWTIWDYPVGHYHAKLRGLSAFELPYQAQARTFCVRCEFDDRTENYTYPTSASYEGYNMPGGLDCNWPEPTVGGGLTAKLMTAPSEVPYIDYGWGRLVPKKYPYQPSVGGDEAVCFQPNTVSALIRNEVRTPPSTTEDYVLPAWSAETQGQMFACMATFSREYGIIKQDLSSYDTTTPSFQDNWQAARSWTYSDGAQYVNLTSPDLTTGV